MANHDQRTTGRWPRRLAWVLACASFLSIVIGAVLTGYGAGGVASDGPAGVHHFWFLYPTGDWLGIWDVFLEHLHRLVGTVSVLAATGLAAMLWRMDVGKGLHRTATAVAGGLWLECLFGGLGILSGRSDPTTIAGVDTPLFLSRFHACIAPAVFALAVVLLERTSVKTPTVGTKARSTVGRWWWLAWSVACGILLQIVLGVQLRQIAIDAAPWWFTLEVWLHLAVAGIVGCGVAWLLIGMRRLSDFPAILRRVRLLGILFALQIVLGVCAWVTSYGWPQWFTEYILPWEHNIVAEGILQVAATTTHVAVASLCLAAAVSLAAQITGSKPSNQATNN